MSAPFGVYQMKRQGTAKVQIDFAEGVAFTFRPQLEVSLDCYICRRRHRTVVMKAIGGTCICTPTRHAFPGTLFEVVTFGREGLFTFFYEYEPFTDQKYPDESRYARWEKGAPSWVRVSFDVTCPSCGLTTERSAQTNLVRPWDCFCKCGTRLYSDRHIPELLWRPYPNTEPSAAPNSGPATPPGNSGVTKGPPVVT
jgi:hypothetical protein